MDSYIDIYCERLEPGLWAEPLNALTNISFFIAAAFALHLAWRENASDWRSASLIGLVLMIGIGSTLFHTIANTWTMLSDALPILFYQIVFLQFYTSRIMRLSCRTSFAIMGLFLMTVYVFGQFPSETLNGSIGYIPALLFLMGLALWHWRHAAHGKHLMIEACGILIVSLTFRTIDMQLCSILPYGTHFMWHILNGIVLYLTTRAYILNANRSSV